MANLYFPSNNALPIFNDSNIIVHEKAKTTKFKIKI